MSDTELVNVQSQWSGPYYTKYSLVTINGYIDRKKSRLSGKKMIKVPETTRKVPPPPKVSPVAIRPNIRPIQPKPAFTFRRPTENTTLPKFTKSTMEEILYNPSKGM